MYRSKYKELGVQHGLQEAYDQIKIAIDNLITGGHYTADDSHIQGMAVSLDVILDQARVEGVEIVKGHMDAPTLRIDDTNY